MSNRLKSEVTEDVREKKERPKKNKPALKSRIERFRNFLSDERTYKVFGLVLLMTSFFMVIAFVSNLFTWKEDQAIAGVDSVFKLLIHSDIRVENWLGKIGALTALKFQNEWFGI